MVHWREIPQWVWAAIAIGWCGAALGISYQVAMRGGNRGKKLAVVPMLLLPFLLLSALPPSVTTRVALVFTLCWVTPCKLLLLWVANLLVDGPSWSLSHYSHFVVAFLLPVRIKGMNGGRGFCTGVLITVFIELLALHFCLSFYDHHLHQSPLITHFLGLYLALSLPHNIASIALFVLFGVETYPIFCSPWLSTSITDFWGRRWDLTANALLRHIIYNPTVNLLITSSCKLHSIKEEVPSADPKTDVKLHSGLAVLKSTKQVINSHTTDFWVTKCMEETNGAVGTPRPTKPMPALVCSDDSKNLSLSVRLIGVNTTFFASGLLHELIYFCLTQGVVPTWEVTSFFVVQGIATSAEITFRRTYPNHVILKMPRPIKIVLTLGFLYATSVWLFFPQLVRARTFFQCASEYNGLYSTVVHKLNHF